MVPSGGCLRDVVCETCVGRNVIRVLGGERARMDKGMPQGVGGSAGASRVVEFDLSEVGPGAKIECGEINNGK